MKLIAQIRLNPTPEQHAALLATLTEANAACDAISAVAWHAREFRRIPIQKLSYHQLKDSFQLGAQILIRCIAKVADAYKGSFYLLAVCEVPEPDEQQMDGVLGLDLGIVNLATDSDGESHSGQPIERKREWYARRRAALQAVGTKSAKRRLRQLSGRQRRFQKNTNHCISKELVAKAERTKRTIAVEEVRRGTRSGITPTGSRNSEVMFLGH
jgi:hypothetical protein